MILFVPIPCQQTHGAPHHTQHPLHGHLHILHHLVIGRCVKVDVEYLKWTSVHHFTLKQLIFSKMQNYTYCSSGCLGVCYEPSTP